MDLEAQWTGAASTAVALITTYGLRVVGAIIILLAGWMASRIVYSAVVRLCQKSPRIDRTVALFLANGARYLALVFTFVAVLTTFGIATTSFVAVLGALGIAVGLALQGTLSNLAAGIMLVLFRPFHIGDRIETANVGGSVCEINLFFTEIDGDDNARIIIPNGKLWGEIVRVPTRNDTARIEITFQRPANDDIGAAIGRLKELIGRDKRVLRVADIGVDSVGDGNYTLAAHLWVTRRDATAMRFDLNRTVKEEFERRPLAGSGAPRRIGLASAPWMPPSRCPSRSPSGSRPRSHWAARPCSRSATCMAAPAELRVLLDAIARLAGEAGGKRRLIYLGDMINRGPDSVGVLEQWAAGEEAHGVDHVDRLMGNHEIMMLLTVIGGPHAHKAETMWLSKRMGGTEFSIRCARGPASRRRGADQALLKAALGEAVVHRLWGMRSHVRLGNTLFVHGGLDPHADTDEFLTRPWTIFTEARWAWINHGFLDWKAGFKGTLVVHGHTPPDKHRAISGMEDPHLFEGDRLGLDGGSARTGIVTAAEIRDGRYRILKAGTAFANPISSGEE